MNVRRVVGNEERERERARSKLCFVSFAEMSRCRNAFGVSQNATLGFHRTKVSAIRQEW